MTADGYFGDARLAQLYDVLTDGRPDFEFYLALADRIGARAIADLGCGTGALSIELARRGHRVIGIDPSTSMLAVARSRPGHDKVTWIDGDATALASIVDLVVMTGHVVQFFLDDREWMGALHAIHNALAPGGYLAFESRNPASKPWLRWNPRESFRRLTGVEGGPIEAWYEVTGVAGDRVSVDEHHRIAGGEDLVESSTLRFPPLSELTKSLREVGFLIDAAYGDWDSSPITESSMEFILVAVKAGLHDPAVGDGADG